MSESTQPIGGPLHPALTLSTAAARTSVPQPKAGDRVFLRLTDFQLTRNDKGQILNLSWEHTQPYETADGQNITPGAFGSKDRSTIFMYAGEGKDQTAFVTQLSRLVDALLGTGDTGNTKNKPVRPELIAPGSTLGNVQFNQDVVAALRGQVASTKMRQSKRDGAAPGDVEFGFLDYPGDVKA